MKTPNKKGRSAEVIAKSEQKKKAKKRQPPVRKGSRIQVKSAREFGKIFV